MISPVFFSIFFFFFLKFLFFGLLGGKRAKNSLKWKIAITSITHNISGTVKHMIMILIHLCKMMISPGVFFHFWGCWGGRKGGRVKGKGIGQNEKNNYICHMPCLRNIGIYGLSSMVHLSKMMISPGVFFILSKFWFSGLLGEWGRGVWRGKKWSKMRKNYVCRSPYLRNHASYDFHLWYCCLKW